MSSTDEVREGGLGGRGEGQLWNQEGGLRTMTGRPGESQAGTCEAGVQPAHEITCPLRAVTRPLGASGQRTFPWHFKGAWAGLGPVTSKAAGGGCGHPGDRQVGIRDQATCKVTLSHRTCQLRPTVPCRSQNTLSLLTLSEFVVRGEMSVRCSSSCLSETFGQWTWRRSRAAECAAECAACRGVVLTHTGMAF